jgi:polyribonucleotide nucleotidyltransferase
MARGWGKSAEDVEQEAEERARQRAAPQVDDSPEARERRERRASLQLSRARTLEQLERATNRAHREMLRRTLRSLEAQLEELDGGAGSGSAD